MSERVTITECPRDAFQGLPHPIPTEIKIAYVLSLIRAGFTRIDFGSFVSPKAVPQMKDTRDVLEAIASELGRTELIAIVPNLQGLESAIGTRGIRFAGFALSVSETFQQRNFRQSLQQAWNMVQQLHTRCQLAGMELLVHLSMAFGNPYGDPWSADLVQQSAIRLEEMGVRHISLADTVGAANPVQVNDLFSVCRRVLPPSVVLGAHLHSRPESWEGVVMAAYSAGCRSFDGALRGIGGCPFAADHLVGNIPTERMVQKFFQEGILLDVTPSSIQEPLQKAGDIYAAYGKRLVQG
jgi:hydroxymethylglutaryl-CoA lyase